MPFLLHELLLTLWKKLPRHFGRHGQGSSLFQCFAMDGEPSVQWIIYRWKGVVVKQDNILGRAGLSDPKSSVYKDLPRCFLMKLHWGSPLKDIQSPTIYESVLKNIYKEKWNDVVSQNDEKIAINLWDLYHLFDECHCHTKGFCKSVLSVFKFEICLIEHYC